MTHNLTYISGNNFFSNILYDIHDKIVPSVHSLKPEGFIKENIRWAVAHSDLTPNKLFFFFFSLLFIQHF